MAALIAEATGAMPDLVEGNRGEFTVWVGDREVAGKTRRGFPSDDTVLSAVREALKK